MFSAKSKGQLSKLATPKTAAPSVAFPAQVRGRLRKVDKRLRRPRSLPAAPTAARPQELERRGSPEQGAVATGHVHRLHLRGKRLASPPRACEKSTTVRKPHWGRFVDAAQAGVDLPFSPADLEGAPPAPKKWRRLGADAWRQWSAAVFWTGPRLRPPGERSSRQGQQQRQGRAVRRAGPIGAGRLQTTRRLCSRGPAP